VRERHCFLLPLEKWEDIFGDQLGCLFLREWSTWGEEIAGGCEGDENWSCTEECCVFEETSGIGPAVRNCLEKEFLVARKSSQRSLNGAVRGGG
jgi:hypothetical protein